MKDVSILKPVLAQVLLTFVILFWMAKERLGAMRAGKVTGGTGGARPVWPERAAVVSNAFHNQFEMPVLFYAAAAFALAAGMADTKMIGLAWAYVALRWVHTAIHTTYNYIPHRFLAYLASNFVLIAMWVNLALGVFIGR